MADQAASSTGRSSIAPDSKDSVETSPAGAPADGQASAAAGAEAKDVSAEPSSGRASEGGTASGETASGEAETDEGIAEEESAAEPASPGFGERGRMRRRLRFLRKARELAYRDLGGLVFELQRLGERREELVARKLTTLAAIDAELRALEDALGDRRPITVLRESGIAACPRCAAIHGSDDRFCPACGLSLERHADRPIAPSATGPAVAAVAATTAAAPTATAPAASAPAAAPADAGQAATVAPADAARAATVAPVAARPASRAPVTEERSTEERPTEILRPSDPAGGEDG